MPYEDLACEALCFGWVDSLIKRLDNNRYAIKVTPRKPRSKWSDINRRRWNELKAADLLAPAGLAAAPTANRYAAHPPIPELPAYVAKAIKTNVKAWRFFQQLAATYRRDFVVWIHTAKRPETRGVRRAAGLSRAAMAALASLARSLVSLLDERDDGADSAGRSVPGIGRRLGRKAPAVIEEELGVP